MTRLEMQTEHLELRRLRPWLDEAAFDLGPTFVGRIELCVHELAANVVDHSGAPTLSLELTRTPNRISIELTDDGAPFRHPRPEQVEPHPRVHGYGILIAEHLADELIYERRRSTNIWHIEFSC